MQSTIATLRQDSGYRWNEDQTAAMSDDAIWQYLRTQAQELNDQDEPECVYHIYREIVWRFPDRPQAWREFARAARSMGCTKEAQAAEQFAAEL
jgi:hypothetical protein